MPIFLKWLILEDVKRILTTALSAFEENTLQLK